ncbi:ABC transporter permease [Actinomadura madurae]|uniref:ABC transporter permease n=1 Tax=Actinomadura madurae TaxID=1993 RepID=UPI002025BC17|nr:ABC transporter permease [Actinomadura madurae]MCP9951192.1 ABC transporter permease [Actinomadura madurae]MCP9967964.1 ABC transporter permease [Actinomadura madurae]MCP9980424.1 ABC transporter permease [Actinomadura madurae]MCQ0008060.1 ABC transporter permease [Actinomadura madurae]MCQ0016626.1 ABC transporter permease [Actinomadura madurae]
MSAETKPVPDVDNGGAPETVPIERGFMGKYGGTAGVWAARVVLVAAVLLIWQWAADRWFDVIFTSRPSEIWERLVEWHEDGVLWSNTWVTIQEIVYGFALGAALGVVIGFVLASASVLYRVLDPFIMALYSIPKVALAPLFIVWFGIGMNMKVFLAAATVFFLVFLNTVAGVREVDRGLIDAVRLMGGGRAHVLLKVVLPGSMTGVLTGLKVAIPYALIGAVIGELVASNRGLGYLINDAAAQFDTAGVFATLVVLSVIAAVLNLLVGLLDRRLSRWKPLEARR